MLVAGITIYSFTRKPYQKENRQNAWIYQLKFFWLDAVHTFVDNNEILTSAQMHARPENNRVVFLNLH